MPNIMTNIVPPACLRLYPWVRVIPFIFNNSPQNVNVHKISASHTNPENELKVLGSNSTFPTWPIPPLFAREGYTGSLKSHGKQREHAIFQ